MKSQLCPESINAIMENNQSHKSGANSTLYNVAMKGFPLYSHIFIWTSTVCFAVTKFPSTNLIYLSVYTNEPGIKCEISGVMWKVALQSKIRLVSCKICTKSLLGLCTLEDIHSIEAYIFCESLSSSLFFTSYLFSLICTHEF